MTHSGHLPLIDGTRRTADSLDIGVFTQDLAQDLDMNVVALDLVLDTVRRKDPTISNERARSVLGSLGITGSMALQKIGTMSGGEKARVALANFVLVPHNILMLDEPSNHLDSATVQVLTQALQEYKGTIIVVTHNRPFCEQLQPTHVATVVGEPGMYIYILYMYVHTYICMYIHICVYIHMYVCIAHARSDCGRRARYVHICIIYIYTYIYMYVFTYVCIYICMYV